MGQRKEIPTNHESSAERHRRCFNSAVQQLKKFLPNDENRISELFDDTEPLSQEEFTTAHLKYTSENKAPENIRHKDANDRTRAKANEQKATYFEVTRQIRVKRLGDQEIMGRDLTRQYLYLLAHELGHAMMPIKENVSLQEAAELLHIKYEVFCRELKKVSFSTSANDYLEEGTYSIITSGRGVIIIRQDEGENTILTIEDQLHNPMFKELYADAFTVRIAYLYWLDQNLTYTQNLQSLTVFSRSNQFKEMFNVDDLTLPSILTAVIELGGFEYFFQTLHEGFGIDDASIQKTDSNTNAEQQKAVLTTLLERCLSNLLMASFTELYVNNQEFKYIANTALAQRYRLPLQQNNVQFQKVVQEFINVRFSSIPIDTLLDLIDVVVSNPILCLKFKNQLSVERNSQVTIELTDAEDTSELTLLEDALDAAVKKLEDEKPKKLLGRLRSLIETDTVANQGKKS